MRGQADMPRTPPKPGSGARDDAAVAARLDPPGPTGRLPRFGQPSDPAPAPVAPPGASDDEEAMISLWLPAAAPERPAALSRAAIVAAAIELADAEGIDAVSIRRVAGALGARPMSLYSHIGRKQDLIDLMVNEAVSECLVRGDLSTDWREALRLIAHHLRDGARRHPWMLSVTKRGTVISPNSLATFDQALAALSGLDIDGDRKITIILAVRTYTIGHVVRELAGFPPPGHTDATGDPAGQDQAPAAPGAVAVGPADVGTGEVSGRARRTWLHATASYLRQMIETGEYPHLAAFGVEAIINAHETETAAADSRFVDGLDLLLDGIAASLAAG